MVINGKVFLKPPEILLWGVLPILSLLFMSPIFQGTGPTRECVPYPTGPDGEGDGVVVDVRATETKLHLRGARTSSAHRKGRISLPPSPVCSGPESGFGSWKGPGSTRHGPIDRYGSFTILKSQRYGETSEEDQDPTVWYTRLRRTTINLKGSANVS